MVRSAEEVKAFIKARIAANPLISAIAANPDFDNSIIGQFVECFAEEMEDIIKEGQAYIDQVESIIDYTNPHTALWIRQKALEFQYDENTPQILELVEGVPTYQIIDESLRPVVNCCVRASASRLVNVYAAGDDLAEPLSADHVASLKDYFNSFLAVSNALAGTTCDVISTDPDIAYIKGTIYYYGQKSATIQANVIAAIEAFLKYCRVDGVLTAIELIKAVLAVEGVFDFVIDDLAVRDNATLFGAKTFIIQNKIDQLVTPLSVSGFYIAETEVGNELVNKLTFTAL
jgi:hypothetical protein